MMKLPLQVNTVFEMLAAAGFETFCWWFRA